MAGTLGLTTGDYSSAEVVPSAAMNRKLENFMLCFGGGSIPSNPTRWIKWEAVKIPWACDVVYASAWVKGVMTGGSIDFYEDASSILSAPIAVYGDTHSTGTISDASIAQNAELSLRVLAEGGVYHLKACVTIARD